MAVPLTVVTGSASGVVTETFQLASNHGLSVCDAADLVAGLILAFGYHLRPFTA